MIKLFLILQVLDLTTTLLGLRLGLAEASPAVRLMMKIGPVVGMLLAKAIAITLLGLCLWLRRPHTIRKANYFFSALVVWNFLIISGRMAGVM